MAYVRQINDFVDRVLEMMVHPALRIESDIFYRTRVLIGFLLTSNVLLFAVCLVSIAGGMSEQARVVGFSLCAALMTGNFLMLYFIRMHGRYLLCSHLSIAVSTLAIILGIVLSGGIRQSPAAQLVVVPPLMVFFFLGIHEGVWSVAIMIGIVLVLFVLERSGVKFPVNANAADIDQSRMQTSFLCIAVVSGLALVFERTASKLKRERDAEHQRALLLAETDMLTGLANRRSFDATLNARIGAEHGSHEFALCYIDLDGFKPINDRYGHAVGDEVLREIASRLRQSVRDNDVVGRHGGDEFTLIIAAPSDAAALQVLMERMLASICMPVETSAGPLSVGASIGLAFYPRHGTTADALKKAADHAMYAAKRQRNRWCVYTGISAGTGTGTHADAANAHADSSNDQQR